MVVVLGLTYIHRHYTLLLVYGDRQILSQRIRDYILSPLLIFALLIGSRISDLPWTWTIIIIIVAFWNIWHVIMQRYGILRVYAGRSKGGIEQHAHGRRDLFLLWSFVVVIICGAALYQRPSFATLGKARFVMKALSFVDQNFLLWLIPTIVGITALIALVWWLRNELAAELSWRQRVPRWTFLISTLTLLAIFVIHGPIVGYLCFGMAHAVEYIAFVHLYGHGKYQDRNNRDVAAFCFRSALKGAPLLIAGMGLTYYLLLNLRGTDFYIVYYSGTSLLHFLYDGWIWKVRKPEVARPLGVT